MSKGVTRTEVANLKGVDRSWIELVGGKAANLGELSLIEGVRVPAGLCVTTEAFDRVVSSAPPVRVLVERLERLGAQDRDQLVSFGAELRAAVEQVAVPADLTTAIDAAVAELDGRGRFAVRSSATAEDQPSASFAGQADSFLQVEASDVVDHVRRCWASLYTERAVAYRVHHGIEHRSVRMAVVVQRMVDARVSGVLFTADPVTSNRRVARVEAVPGLADALVSGRVDAESHEVRDDEVVRSDMVSGRGPRLLDDGQILRLVELGRRVADHFGGPQDIEWCLDGDDIQLVQSRPITTLFPVPERDDGERHVYVSVGHQQMMTDPMKPLGRSLFQLTALRPMYDAAGRLFVDITDALASPAGREAMVAMLGRSDPLIGDALGTLLARDGLDDTAEGTAASAAAPPAAPPAGVAPPADPDPAIVPELIERTQASIERLRRELHPLQGSELLDAIVADVPELQRCLADPDGMPLIMAGMEAAFWLNEHLGEWLGEPQAADTLARSVPHNITSEMGLALLDVADAIRPHPEVVEHLRRAAGPAVLKEMGGLDEMEGLDGLAALEGGSDARAAIDGFLDRYGMRCVGEIDITRPRWSERPAELVPLILGNVERFEPGERARRFEQGRQQAIAKEREVLERLAALPDGAAKVEQTRRMIERLRTCSGYREYPKYGLVCRYAVYKAALHAEAARLVEAGVLERVDDIDDLTFQELQEVVRTGLVDRELLARRREEHLSFQALTPPRVLTSDGEAVAGSYRRDDTPDGALVGLAVSAGVVEGRARVLRDIADGDLEEGDILVTTFTDPSWSPLFVAIGGLVTEVGGVMTHGAVVAREYGLPAVVGVQQATQLIRDGQRIRVHGGAGYVELLDG